jgi:hypothetical protein
MNSKRGLKVGWLLVQSALAGWFLLSTASDRQVIFLFVLALSFPAGFLPVFAVVPLAVVVDSTAGIDIWLPANIAIWVGTVAIGYWQWFVLLPRLRHGRTKPCTGRA